MNKKRIFGISVIVLLSVFAVKAGKPKEYKYRSPAGFSREATILSHFLPAQYVHKGGEKVSVMISPEYKVKQGPPRTADGKIHPDFIRGRQAFNNKFGIEKWKLDSYRFTKKQHDTVLEMKGSFVGNSGTLKHFEQHSYFSPKNQAQYIEVIYPATANPKVVKSAIASLATFEAQWGKN